MSTNQLNMMMQMVSQSYNKPSSVNKNQSENNKDSFKDLMGKKTADSNKPQVNHKNEPTTNDKAEVKNPQQTVTDDTAQRQILVANMLLAQNVVQPMVQDITDGQANVQQLIQPLAQGDTNVNAQNIVQSVQTQQVEGKMIEPKNVQAQTINTDGLDNALKPNQNALNQNQNIAEEIKIPQQIKQVQTPENSQLNDNTQSQGKMLSNDVKVESESEPTPEIQTPLFKDVESAPIKVGESTQTLDTQSPDMEEKLKDIIKYNIKNVGDKVEIQLNPHNLGKITIELVEKDGLTSVLMTAENHKTMSLLAQHAGSIETLMQDKLAQPVHVYVEQQPQQYDDANRQQRQQQQNNQQNSQSQSKDEQQSFVDQLRLGLINIS